MTKDNDSDGLQGGERGTRRQGRDAMCRARHTGSTATARAQRRRN